MNWVMYCEGCAHEFATEKDALDAAAEAISGCCDGTWSDEVDNIFVARVTHRATRTNVVLDADLGEERENNGKYYPEGCDTYCDYEMLPVDEAAKGGRDEVS